MRHVIKPYICMLWIHISSRIAQMAIISFLDILKCMTAFLSLSISISTSNIVEIHMYVQCKYIKHVNIWIRLNVRFILVFSVSARKWWCIISHFKYMPTWKRIGWRIVYSTQCTHPNTYSSSSISSFAIIIFRRMCLLMGYFFSIR